MPLSDYYDEIARCNHCGFCQAECPTFRATGHEVGVARGRIALLRALIEERLDWAPDLEEPLFECLLCGACMTACFPGLPATDLITAARCEYLERVGRKPLHRLLFNHLLPYPKRLRLAVRAAALGKKTGMSKVAKALGLLRFLGRDFPRAEEIVEHFPRALRAKIEPGELPGEGDALRIGYFVGCGTDIVCPDAAEATLRLLCEVGKTVTLLDNCCCGLPALAYGDRPAAQDLAERNLDFLTSGSFDTIVTDCSSCAAFLKKYPTLFAEDDPRHGAAKAIAARVQDVVEVLASDVRSAHGLGGGHRPSGGHSASSPTLAGKGDHSPTTNRKGGSVTRVCSAHVNASSPALAERGDHSLTTNGHERIVATYHDPCHASRGQGLTAEPRQILQSLPGVEYRELPEADWCCGGAGSYALSHYERSRQILDRKIDNVEKTGANLLVTSCPACIIHLSYGVRLRDLPLRVCHLSEVVSEARHGG